mgnify:CR=1 FL=1
MEFNDARTWLDDCGCDRYPQGFLDEYEPFECLAGNEGTETLLVKNKRTGMFYVAKCYGSDGVVSHATEAEILKKLHHTGLPRFVDEYKSDTMLCVVREYVEGTPLNQWAADKRPGPADTVRVALALCELLIYLHGQTPPIIHRDIKPQNLILGTDGRLWLIDFGISRLYQEEGRADTACWGTQDFAAPEQYGFAQTDVRSDIYSFGILLGWLLTGDIKRESALDKIADKRLRKIVKKCTAFAPAERYASAVKLRADLTALSGHRRRRILLRLGAAALCALCLCAGFAIGRYTELLQPQPAGIKFQEPLIEQAVRLMLGMKDGETLTESDLLSVTALYICGDRVAEDSRTHNEYIDESAQKSTVRNGGIETLEDLLMMPNLMSVSLTLQNISDLTPLAQLASLENLDLRHNPVTDLAPLAGLKQLGSVCLFGTRVEDLSPLVSCPRLTSIDAGGTYVTSVETLVGSVSVRRLWLFKAPLTTLAGIEAFPLLTEFELSSVGDGDLTPLLQLSGLQTVTLGTELQSLAERTLADAEFAIEYRED